jgi:hypothetical protein
MALNIWENQPGMGTFYTVEIDPNDPRDKKNRCIVVTHTVILQLEISTQFPDVGHLLSWATLNALANIQRSRTDSKQLTFHWKQIGNNPPYSQLFEISDAENCIDFISRNMKNLGTLISKQNPTLSLREEDVTSTRIQKMHIDDILQAISVYESSLETQLNFSTINSLMALYQQAIEYYSALNDERFEEYINRLHALLSNEIIQTVLQSQQETEASSLKSFSSMKVEASPGTSHVSNMSAFDEEMKDQLKDEEFYSKECKKELNTRIEEAPLLEDEKKNELDLGD